MPKGTKSQVKKENKKPTNDTRPAALSTITLAKERAELLLSALENLKADVNSIQERYCILRDDYSKIIDDAMSQITALKTDLHNDLLTRTGDSEILKPAMTNLEARYKLGLVPHETYLKENEKESAKETAISSPKGMQLAIDKTANGIELGLDKLGDGIIFPIEIIAKAVTMMAKNIRQKGSSRHHT